MFEAIVNVSPGQLGQVCVGPELGVLVWSSQFQWAAAVPLGDCGTLPGFGVFAAAPATLRLWASSGSSESCPPLLPSL